VDTALDAVLPAAFIDRLRERLRAQPTWPQRFAALDQAFAGLVRDGADVHPDVAYAYDRVVDSGGRVTVADLAGEIGWSARHLTNRFRAEVGLRPKEAARVTRFDRARRGLYTGARLTDVAARAGYFDQAHFTREFHALAGLSPGAWLAAEIGFVQAARAATADHGWHD
jgi:AraC-like DNA-binding protein